MKMVWRAVWTAALLAVFPPGPIAEYTYADREGWKPWNTRADELLLDEDGSTHGVKYCRERMGAHTRASGETCVPCAFCDVGADQCPGRVNPDIEFGDAPTIVAAASRYELDYLTLVISTNHGLDVSTVELPAAQTDSVVDLRFEAGRGSNVCQSGGEWVQDGEGYVCRRRAGDADSDCRWSICLGADKPQGPDCEDQYVARFSWWDICHPGIASSRGEQCSQRDDAQVLQFKTGNDLNRMGENHIPHLSEDFLYRGVIQASLAELLPPSDKNFFRPIIRPSQLDYTSPRTYHHNLPFYLGFPQQVQARATLTSLLPQPELIRSFVFQLMTVTPPSPRDAENEAQPHPSEIRLQFETQVVRPWRFTAPRKTMTCGTGSEPCYSFEVAGDNPDDAGSCYKQLGRYRNDIRYASTDAVQGRLNTQARCEAAGGEWRAGNDSQLIRIDDQELTLIEPTQHCWDGDAEVERFGSQQDCEEGTYTWRAGRAVTQGGFYRGGGQRLPDACQGDGDFPDNADELHKRVCVQSWELRFKLSKQDGDWLCNPNAMYQIGMPLFDRNHPSTPEEVMFPFKLATPHLCPQLVGYTRVVASIHGWTDNKCKPASPYHALGSMDESVRNGRARTCNERVVTNGGLGRTRAACETDTQCVFDESGETERARYGRNPDDEWDNDLSVADFTAWDKGYFRVRVSSNMLGFAHIDKVRVLKIQIQNGSSQQASNTRTLWCRGPWSTPNVDCSDESDTYSTNPQNFSIEDGQPTSLGTNLGIEVNDDRGGAGRTYADFDMHMKPGHNSGFHFFKSSIYELAGSTTNMSTIKVKLLVVYDNGRSRRLIAEVGGPSSGREVASAVRTISVVDAPARAAFSAARLHHWFRLTMLAAIPVLMVTVLALYCRLRSIKQGRLDSKSQHQDSL